MTEEQRPCQHRRLLQAQSVPGKVPRCGCRPTNPPVAPPPDALEAARDALEDARCYRDGASGHLRGVLAKAEDVHVDRVTVASGSTPLLLDIIELAAIDVGEQSTFDKSFIA